MQTAEEKFSDSENKAARDINDHDRLVDLDTVAERLGVCSRTIHRLVAADELPPPAKVGRASRWFVSDVEGYLTKLRHTRDQQYAKRSVEKSVTP